MKKTFVSRFLPCFLTGILTMSAAWPQEDANKHRIVLQEIQALELDGRFHVVLRQGVEECAVIEAPDEVFVKMKAKQSGKTFALSAKDKDTRSYKPFAVYITLRSPEQISLKGAVKVETDGVLTCRKLSLQLSDDALFDAEIRSSESISVKMDNHAVLKASVNAVKSCRMDLSGYAAVSASGYVPSMNLVQRDASKFGGREFRTDKLEAKLSDNSQTGITVNTALSATVEDAAVLLYGGAPKTKVSTSGVAKVSAFGN
ncbi:MAG: DUF2807 domain-containing protein [Bacteroidales bacterium]|nr:DUF2807 domain-containing protein [Bacteroidales bacterium]MDE7072267.1 DUF2807 domain-containing protein [Bacteroidales bacterium]